MNFQGFPVPVLAWALALLPACNPDADDSASPAAPSVPAGLDDSAVLAFHAWSLVGNDLTQGHDELELEVTAPQGATAIQLWIDGAYAGQTPVSGASVAVQGDLGALEAGTHDLVLAADDSDQAFVQLELQRSHPLYVLVTNDWDVSHKEESWLERQEELHANHPAMKMTHFVGPYTFTDPEVSPEHAAELVAWLQGMAADFDDEIGLHVHPYCNFVETTDVPCRHEPSFGYAQDETGYTVELAAYSEDEATTLFEAAKALFEAAGIGTPTSFRAGGWTAEIHTLRALDATGFVVDSSGANWPRLEEWEGLEDAGLYEWNQEHWASVGDTSQPWHPNQDEMLSSDEPTIGLLEVPDNGALVDYVDVYEIIEIFEANWPDGAPLAQPVTYVTGYHPVSYDYRNAIALNGGLDHIDQFLASDGAGPVVYETASNMALVW